LKIEGSPAAVQFKLKMAERSDFHKSSIFDIQFENEMPFYRFRWNERLKIAYRLS
jgi:hypothetical protein